MRKLASIKHLPCRCRFLHQDVWVVSHDDGQWPLDTDAPGSHG
jgi:hypothetical protein